MSAALLRRIRSMLEADMSPDPEPIKRLRAFTTVHASLIETIAHLLKEREGAPEKADLLDWQMVQDFARTFDPTIEQPLLLAAARLRYRLVRYFLLYPGEELLEWLPNAELVNADTDLERFGKQTEIAPKLEVMRKQLLDRIKSPDFLTSGDHWLLDDEDD